MAKVLRPEEDEGGPEGPSPSARAERAKRGSRPVWLGSDERGWDHARIHLQVAFDPRLRAIDQSVYLGIAVHAETQTGAARPAIETLCYYSGSSDRTVRDAVKHLTECGYIAVQTEHGKPSKYRLLPPPVLPAAVLDELRSRGTPFLSAVAGTDLTDEGCGSYYQGVRYQLPRGAVATTDELDRDKNERTTSPPKAPRKRNVVFDAVCDVAGIREPTKTEASHVGKIATEIRATCPNLDDAAIAKEVHRRAAIYRGRFRNATLTPGALAKHWGSLNGKQADEKTADEIWMEAANRRTLIG